MSNIVDDLFKAGARRLWDVRVPNVGNVACFIKDGELVLLLQYKAGGYDVFTQPDTSNSVESTYRALGLKRKGG